MGNATTGDSEPLTTGLTGLSAGDEETTTGQAASTGRDPDNASAGSESGSTDGIDPTMDEDVSSSGGEESGSGSSGDPTTDPTTGPTTGEIGDAVDLSGWTLTQTNSSREFTLPEGTVVPAGGLVVIGRDATRAQFENYWGTLDADVLYLNAQDTFPAINGGETFTLHDAADAVVDGPTPAMEDGHAVRRADVTSDGMWTMAGEADADPGVGHEDPALAGVFLTEASDATGAGNFVYEYVELQAWP